MNKFTFYVFLKSNRKKTKCPLRLSVSCLLFLAVTNLSLAQGTENFNNATSLTNSYADGSFVGNNGITWTYGHSRNEGNFAIDGNGLILRRASDSYLQATIPGGVKSFSFQYRKAETGTNERQLELIINNNVVATSPTFGPPSGENTTIYTLSVDDLDIEGTFTVKIKNVGTTTTNRQTTIDNISWTEYPASPPPCVVNIPDANFKNYLLNNSAINTNGDNEIQCSEASAFDGMINCSNLNISNLTGIEAFTNITELRCQDNNLTTLNVSNNVNLITLRCYSNQLTNLDVSNNTALTRLYCHDNELTTLDVSENDLEYLWCYDNELTLLNVSNNANLERLLCENNQLTTLDLSTNASLDRFRIFGNQLTSLDVSNNPLLNRLWCNDNELTILKIKNGNNLNFITFEAQNNPNLTCIEVDEPVFCTLNWTNIDTGVTFNENCNYNVPCVVNIPNANFKNALLTHNPMIDTNEDGEIQCSEAEAFTGVMDCSNLNISDLTGVEAFVNITGLVCSLNQLTSLEVSQNTALQYLNCGANQLTNLDISNNADLEWLYCHNNQLTNLDVSNNTDLIILYCTNNQFTNLDLTNNINLIELNCYDNPLVFLNVTSNTALEILGCASTGLTTLDISNNTNLKYLDCVFNSLTNLDLSNNTNLEELYCYNNQLTSLDVNNNTALIKLSCSSNSITTLDVSNNTLLKDLSCYSNQLTSLDISNNTTLETLDCPSNQLLSLNAKNGNNSNMWYFDTTNNPNLICIEVDDPAWSTANWTNVDAWTTFSENCGYVSIKNFDLFSFSYYPNPTRDMINFSSNSSIENVVVSNMLGQQVTINLSSDKTSLDISSLAQGNYLVKITIEGVSKTIKVAKQ